MGQGAELLLLLVLGMLLFRAMRPLRDRIEAWFASLSGGGSPQRIVELKRRRDGAFGTEDPNGDD